MKKTINKFLVFLLFVGVTISCNNNTEEAIFNEPTSVRIQKSISEYRDLLTSSENGWIIEYYPDEKQNIGGFNYGVKFNKDLTTEVVHESAFATKASNMFDVIANAGPLLTFNTYTWLTHYYANPNADDSDGAGGDYEFALTSKTADVITLTGAKSRNKMRMFKLTEAPEVYLAKVNEVSSFISIVFGNVINGKATEISLTNRHITFPTSEENGEGEEVKQAIDMAYHFTPTGIKLYEAITVDGNQVSEFTLNKALNQLTSLDGKVVIDLAKSPFNINQDWSIDTTNPSDTSDEFFNKYVEIYNANGAAYGEELQRSILFGNTTTNETSPGILFKSKAPTTTWSTQQKLDFSLINNDSELTISKGAQGLNWSYYTHLDPLVDYIIKGAPYTIDQITPKQVKLTSTADANAWFVLKL